MSAPEPKIRRKRRFVGLLLGLFLGAAAGFVVAGVEMLDRVPGGSAAVSFQRLLTAGEIRYTMPPEFLQREIAAAFPITQGIENVLQFVLSNPRFMPDPDPAFLRVEVALEAYLTAGKPGEHFPGRAVVRSQVRYDPPTRSVRLAHGAMTEFSFDGVAAPAVEVLRPLLQAGFATGMKDYVVLEMSDAAGFWARQGIALIRNVTVEDRKIVVTAGL